MAQIRRILCISILLLFCAASACAEPPLYPKLDNPIDLHMQRLSVMSQRDSAFEGVPYNNGLLTIRGCGPVSIANAVIATFGVTDRNTAIGVVLETADLLVHKPLRKKAPIELTFVPKLLDPDLRRQEQEAYPVMAELLGRYSGSITLSNKTLDAQTVIDRIASQQTPALLVSTISVHPDWTDVVSILYALHDFGYDDATLCLAYGGAGTALSGAPLRTGEYGHYVTLMIHVGSFIREGNVYVLDSLPRALKGETHGYENIYRLRYAFEDDYRTNSFNNLFEGARISPTVIRLRLRPEALAQLLSEPEDSRAALHTRLISPLHLFGRCLMMISLP